MALYHQLKFPSTFIEYRSVSEWKGVVVISNFDSFKSTALGSCLVCLGLNTPLARLLALNGGEWSTSRPRLLNPSFRKEILPVAVG